MCELCELCEQLTKMPMQDNCKYATPLYFYRVNCIFFGFRAFYPQIIQKFVLPLHRNSKSSHVHRTLIALPSHTRTRIAAMSPAGVPVVPVACGCSSSASRVPDGCRKKIILVILYNFVLLNNKIPKIIQDYSLF